MVTNACVLYYSRNHDEVLSTGGTCRRLSITSDKSDYDITREYTLLPTTLNIED